MRYDGLFKSKNTKRSICKTLWFCHDNKKQCVGGQMEYNVLSNVYKLCNSLNECSNESQVTY